MDRDEMLRVLRAFQAAGLEYVIIGATAMAFHGVVRATEDVDLFVRATPDNIERLRSALRAAYGGDPHVDEIRAEDLLGEYPTVRYYPPSGDLYFDILTRLGDAATFETVRAEVKEVEGIRVPVATPAALYQLKRGTLPLNRQDAAVIRERFNLADEDPLEMTRTSQRVQRFRTIEEMNASPVLTATEGAFDRFLRHCARYWIIAPRSYPRGVFRFRSVEDAQAGRHRREAPTQG